MTDKFARAVGVAFADIRNELVVKAWRGEGEPIRPDHDRVLPDKLYPDRIGDADFLQWLDAEWPSANRAGPAEPEHALTPEIGREQDTARQPDPSPDIDR